MSDPCDPANWFSSSSNSARLLSAKIEFELILVVWNYFPSWHLRYHRRDDRWAHVTKGCRVKYCMKLSTVWGQNDILTKIFYFWLLHFTMSTSMMSSRAITDISLNQLMIPVHSGNFFMPQSKRATMRAIMWLEPKD